jgi:hypothetical protein
MRECISVLQKANFIMKWAASFGRGNPLHNRAKCSSKSPAPASFAVQNKALNLTLKQTLEQGHRLIGRERFY